MSLIQISGSGSITVVRPFADDTQSNVEGNSTAQLSVSASCTASVQVLEAYEWWFGSGGWVTTCWNNSQAFYGFGTHLPSGFKKTKTWDVQQYDPVEHVVLQVLATDPNAGTPPQWTFAQFGVTAKHLLTVWKGAVETEPDALSLSIAPLAIGTPGAAASDSVLLTAMAPTDVFDVVVKGGTGALRIARTLVLTGQIVNWFDEESIRNALKLRNGTTRLMLEVTDADSKAVLLSEDLLQGPNAIGPFSTAADAPMSRVSAFTAARELPQDFTHGNLTLRLVTQQGTFSFAAPIQYQAVKPLHWPFVRQAADSPWIKFGNATATNAFNSHNGNLHERYAVDFGVANADANTLKPNALAGQLDSYFGYGTPVLSVADGVVRAVFDGATDHASSNMPPVNRVFIEHMREGRKEYSAYAHLAKNSAAEFGVVPGLHVKAGQSIGRMGSNGYSSEPHTHLGYYMLDSFGRYRALPMAFSMKQSSPTSSVVGVGQDRLLAQPGSWDTWWALGGHFKGEPAALFRQPGICDVFARGIDDRLLQRSWVAGAGWWKNWIDVTSPNDAGFKLLGSPVACSSGPDQLQLFANGSKGPNDQQVYTKFWTAAQSWGDWQPLGGNMTGTPAAFFRQPGICDVFVRGPNDRLMERSWLAAQGGWNNWTTVPDQPGDAAFKLLSSPTATSAGPNHVQIFAYGTKGATDQQVYSKYWTAANSWSSWTPLGGRIKGAPSACFRQPGICDVLVRGMDDRLFQKSWVAGAGWWPHWLPISSAKDAEYSMLTSPIAVSSGPDQLQLFFGGSKGAGDDQLYSKLWGAGTSWTDSK